jgi:hypothetical protein
MGVGISQVGAWEKTGKRRIFAVHIGITDITGC